MNNLATRHRVGLIASSSNMTAEPKLHAHLPADVALDETRLPATRVDLRERLATYPFYKQQFDFSVLRADCAPTRRSCQFTGFALLSLLVHQLGLDIKLARTLGTIQIICLLTWHHRSLKFEHGGPSLQLLSLDAFAHATPIACFHFFALGSNSTKRLNGQIRNAIS